MRAIHLFLLLPSLAACTGEKDTGDGSTGGDGGGTTGDGGTTLGDGCISLDGVVGYDEVNQAVAAASAGSTISLEGCEDGPHVEDILLDKGVHLVSKEGIQLEPDFEDQAITITADGASVSSATFTYGKAGVRVSGAQGVVLSDLKVDGVSQWAVVAEESSSIELSGAVIRNVGKGGVSVDGGTASLSGLDILDSKGFGVLGQGGAVVSVSGSTIAEMRSSSSSAGDGVALGVIEASLSSAGNTMTDAALYAVYADLGSVVMDGDLIEGGQFGVLANDSSLQASGVSVLDATTCGIYAFTEGQIALSDTTITATEGVVPDVSASTWNEEPYRGAGAFLIGPDTTLTDLSIDGYSGVGALVYSESSGEATLTRVTLRNQGNHGLYLSNVDTRATDVSVRDMRAMTTSPDEMCFEVDSDVGVLVVGGELDWTGGEIVDVEGYGISGIDTELIVDGATIASTWCAGVMSFGSSANITYSDFSGARGAEFAGSVVSYEGSTLYIGGSTFTDNRAYDIYRSEEFSSGGSLIRYDYSQYVGSDIQVWYGGAAELVMNTHQGGVNGVELYPGHGTYPTATMRNSTFTDYTGLIGYVSTGSTLSLTDTSVDGHGAYGLACQGGSMNLTRVSLANGGFSESRTSVYTDDVLTYELDSPTYGPSVLAESCALRAEDLSISEAQESAMGLSDASWDLRDIEITGAGRSGTGHGIEVSASSTSSSLYIDGLVVSGVDNGDGVSVQARTSATVTMQDAVIDSVGGAGLSFSNTGSSSVSASATLLNVDVASAMGAGIELSAFSSTLTTVSADANGGSGIVLSGGTTSLSSTVTDGNTEYGLVCGATSTLTSCGLSASDNLLGATSGCDAWCSSP